MIDNINFLEQIIILLINIIGFWLALWVYNTDKKKKTNKWFLIMTFFTNEFHETQVIKHSDVRIANTIQGFNPIFYISFLF